MKATPTSKEVPVKVQALLEQLEQLSESALADLANSEIVRQSQALTPEEREAFVWAMCGRFAWVTTSSEEFASRKQEEKELES